MTGHEAPKKSDLARSYGRAGIASAANGVPFLLPCLHPSRISLVCCDRFDVVLIRPRRLLSPLADDEVFVYAQESKRGELRWSS